MWVFLSRRLRRWLLLAVALPVVRKLVHKAAVNAQRRSPASAPARLLGRADSTLNAVSQQGKTRRRRYRRQSG